MMVQKDKTQKSQLQTIKKEGQEYATIGEASFIDNRRSRIYRRKLQESIQNPNISDQKQVIQLKRSSRIKELQREEEERRRMQVELDYHGFSVGIQEMNEIYKHSKKKNIYIEDLIDLFNTGADFEEIKAVLEIEPDVAKVKGLMQTSSGNPDLQDIQYMSSKDGKTGSIYFSNGRIRLRHEDGPGIEIHEHGVERYQVPDSVKKSLDHKFFDTYFNEVQSNNDYLLSSRVPLDSDKVLIEVAKNKYGNEEYHPSRGAAQPFEIKGFQQRHLNILYNIAHQSSEEIAGINREIEQVTVIIGEIKTIDEELEDFEGIELNTSDIEQKTRKEEEKRLEQEKLKEFPTLKELELKKKDTIHDYNELLTKWVTNHPILKQIVLND
ncbi:hypothetical protein [uncultured Aquimarina sp.]|uniref:hypothetical protein n=1 Tax=uncultured Aquimarina sp. TaxID=575652 RepID=UPI00261993E6|nr:hypothetical protein [uncultured Aquimarina sp.]